MAGEWFSRRSHGGPCRDSIGPAKRWLRPACEAPAEDEVTRIRSRRCQPGRGRAGGVGVGCVVGRGVAASSSGRRRLLPRLGRSGVVSGVVPVSRDGPVAGNLTTCVGSSGACPVGGSIGRPRGRPRPDRNPGRGSTTSACSSRWAPQGAGRHSYDARRARPGLRAASAAKSGSYAGTDLSGSPA